MSSWNHVVHNLFKLKSMAGDAHRAAHVDFSVDFEDSICNLLNSSFFVYSNAEETYALGITKRPLKCYIF